MKKTGIWLNYPGVPLEDREVVLIKRKELSYFEMATYNEYEDVFDDAEGDDYLCDADEVSKILLIPDIE